MNNNNMGIENKEIKDNEIDLGEIPTLSDVMYEDTMRMIEEDIPNVPVREQKEILTNDSHRTNSTFLMKLAGGMTALAFLSSCSTPSQAEAGTVSRPAVEETEIAVEPTSTKPPTLEPTATPEVIIPESVELGWNWPNPELSDFMDVKKMYESFKAERPEAKYQFFVFTDELAGYMPRDYLYIYDNKENPEVHSGFNYADIVKSRLFISDFDSDLFNSIIQYKNSTEKEQVIYETPENDGFELIIYIKNGKEFYAMDGALTVISSDGYTSYREEDIPWEIFTPQEVQLIKDGYTVLDRTAEKTEGRCNVDSIPWEF